MLKRLYSHYFDATILNEHIDLAYKELLQVIWLFTAGTQWVPSDWLY